MLYLLDANVFIEAKNRYYAFDIVPAFWTWMDYVAAKNVRTITMVRDELLVKDDPLGDWMRARKDADWILPVDDEATQVAFADISQPNWTGRNIIGLVSRSSCPALTPG